MIKTFFSIGVLVASFAAPLAAQRGMGMRMGPMHYDASTEATMAGTVMEVKQIPAGGRGSGGVHLKFGAPEGEFEVHVGPAAYVASRNFTFTAGDALTVTGSKTTIDGRNVILAREIRKGDQVLTLRNAEGFPLWSGRGGRF